MARLLVHVEGKTEETFVKATAGPCAWDLARRIYPPRDRADEPRSRNARPLRTHRARVAESPAREHAGERRVREDRA